MYDYFHNFILSVLKNKDRYTIKIFLCIRHLQISSRYYTEQKTMPGLEIQYQKFQSTPLKNPLQLFRTFQCFVFEVYSNKSGKIEAPLKHCFLFRSPLLKFSLILVRSPSLKPFSGPPIGYAFARRCKRFTQYHSSFFKEPRSYGSETTQKKNFESQLLDFPLSFFLLHVLHFFFSSFYHSFATFLFWVQVISLSQKRAFIVRPLR